MRCDNWLDFQAEFFIQYDHNHMTTQLSNSHSKDNYLSILVVVTLEMLKRGFRDLTQVLSELVESKRKYGYIEIAGPNSQAV